MKSILQLLLLCSLLMNLASCHTKTAEHFEIKKGQFYLNEEPIQLVCGEMHYPRIPHEYWRDRLQRAKAMGLNTMSAYVFWNYHERQPGVFDFDGQADLAKFITMAQEEGLYVILRPGPYVCAEWDFGGYPSWLLKEEGMVYRSNDEKFLVACERYIARLGKELAHLTVENGGPILMVQVENEYGSYDDDKVYLGKLRDMIIDAGFNVPLMTCDGAGQMQAGYVDGALATVNGAVGEDIFKSVDRFSPGGPYFVAEFYPAWFDVWGTKHSYRDYKKPTKQLEWMIKNGVSVSIYMFHGGTNFDYTNGANTAYGYAPQPTSYDYDAPLGEHGNAYPKYYAFREVLQKHLHKGEALPDVPAENPIIEIPEIKLNESAALAEAFNSRKKSVHPLSMEDVNQDFGYIHYETELTKAVKGQLTIKDVRDYAVIMLNGKQIGSLDRRHRQSSIEIDVKQVPAKLEIIVENVGRVNYGSDILNNRKGITEKVSINGEEILNWTNTPLPLYKAPVGQYAYSAKNIKGQPAFHKANFNLKSLGDTFLDLSDFGKGAVWINGRSLGKFWNIGPQQTLYVPAPWLKEGNNELLIFTLEDTGARKLGGLKQPILDQLGKDKNAQERPKRNNNKKPQLDDGDVVLKSEMLKQAGWQSFSFENAITLRHLALQTLSSFDDDFSCLSELEVLDENGKPITKDTWKVVYASSEEEMANEGFADYLIDGDLGSYWHSKWHQKGEQHPHTIIIDLGEITNATGLRLRHRNITQAGVVKDFKVYARPQFFLFND
ncbi:beta-galactosidase [Carboxylicivirga sp. M1479]|uniref:beta-galactosidase n=1 Tax=Carboxylicivirga sp. M1479 TaxID=2594476 RepID=UPI0011775903|nr:beta-galactosidase [Carboxylicivirga sp. M1479]TRX71238.1 beta-galactosidase [Carboxylicivirga sp. M1479]